MHWKALPCLDIETIAAILWRIFFFESEAPCHHRQVTFDVLQVFLTEDTLMPPIGSVAAPEDLAKVNVCLPSDIRYWTRVLGVSETDLRKAVMLVGDSSWHVRAELRRWRRK